MTKNSFRIEYKTNTGKRNVKESKDCIVSWERNGGKKWKEKGVDEVALSQDPVS